MGFRKLLILTGGVAAGYFLYKYYSKWYHEPVAQWEDEPGPTIEDSPIDEASWESFPASDPPAFNMSRSRAG